MKVKRLGEGLFTMFPASIRSSRSQDTSWVLWLGFSWGPISTHAPQPQQSTFQLRPVSAAGRRGAGLPVRPPEAGARAGMPRQAARVVVHHLPGGAVPRAGGQRRRHPPAAGAVSGLSPGQEDGALASCDIVLRGSSIRNQSRNPQDCSHNACALVRTDKQRLASWTDFRAGWQIGRPAR